MLRVVFPSQQLRGENDSKQSDEIQARVSEVLFEEFKLQKNCESNLLIKTFWGLVEMMFSWASEC